MLSSKKYDLLWLEDPISIYYAIHLSLSTGKLLISKQGAALFVDGRYLEVAKKKNPCPVFPLSDEKILDYLLSLQKKELAIGFDSATTSYASHQKWQELMKKWEKKTAIAFHLVPEAAPLQELRVVKDQEEIRLLKKAAKLNWQGLSHISSLLQESISEKELAWEFELFCRKNGAERLAFDPIIAFGENSAYPHYRAGSALLKKNECVLMDVGVVVDSYRSDLTRTLFFGKASGEMARIASLVQEAHNQALLLCRPGVQIGLLDRAVRQVFARAKVESHYVHSLGHGVGLEIHEYPRIKEQGEDRGVTLLPGMVFTIEPGLYFPGIGGVRYEDTILITEQGYENFYPESSVAPNIGAL